MLQTHFEEMVSLAKAEGVRGEKGNNHFLTIVGDSHIFIFKPEKRLHPIDLTKENEDDGIMLDLPFQTCYIEMDEDVRLTVGREGEPVDIISMLVHETAPTQYEYFLYAEAWGIKRVVQMESEVNGMIIKGLLERLKTESVGTVPACERFKVKIKDKKVVKKINHAIYVAPKSYRSAIENRFHSKINWDHAWEVRGHWRRVQGNGHDRTGTSIKGFTWVRPYQKGTGVLVKKNRIINTSK